MDDPYYLDPDEAIRCHGFIMERTGSPPCPLLFPDKLETALNRPRNAFFYDGADLIRQAAILAIGVSQAQAFQEGNKRAAFAITDVFLRANGYVFRGDPLELARHLERVAESLIPAERREVSNAFEAWLRTCTFPGDGEAVVQG